MGKTCLRLALLPLLAAALPAQRPWQQITVPSLSEAAANFKTPPREYGAIQPFWNLPSIAGSNLQNARERIIQDLDRLAANGVFVVNMAPVRSPHPDPKYLSPEHMSLVKFAVQEAAKRGMKLWLQDESDYPSGFAGGKIVEQYPQLCMQGILADVRIAVTPGQRFSMPAPPDTLGAFFVDPATGTTQVVPVRDGQLKWIPPPPIPPDNGGSNQPVDLVLVRHVYRSGPTRSFNREDGTRAKDALYPLIDYLDVDATRAFIKITHETYRQAIGDEFGKTVLGFFGDENDYDGLMPWTPRLLDEFRRQKGYDLQPYLPLLFAPKMTDEAWRVKADYWDVWSGIFGKTFFGELAEWCARNNLEYIDHLDVISRMLQLDAPGDMIRHDGEFFRDMRSVQVPGCDNLGALVPGAVHTADGTWDENKNYPKVPSSAAHLFGRPKAWTEGGGGPGIDGKFQVDYQLVRGLTALQIRIGVDRGGGGGGNAAGPAPAMPPQASMLAWYTNRAGYLMSIGRPAAQVGLYHPENSMWMGDEEADRSTTKLGWQLFEHQVDWDYFDEQSLSSVAAIQAGGFRNLSGQVYRAIVVPSSTVISKTGLERFQAFVKAGGKVIFVGRTPKLVVDKTFLNAKDTPDLSFATLIEPSGDITPQVIAVLPKPDVKLDAAFPRLTYTHRSWRDADLYFFFNESNQEQSRTATVAGRGQAQVWDLGTGTIHPMAAATAEGDSVRFPLVLGPYETKVVVVGPLPGGVAAPEPSLVSGTTLAELGGDWTLELSGKSLTTPLKSWEDLGTPSFAGPATYRKHFTVSAAPAGQRVFLEIADVNDYARVKLNGKEMEGRAWQPYRWEVTNMVKAGSNDLEVEVRTTASGGGGVPSGPGGPPAAPAAVPGAGAPGTRFNETFVWDGLNWMKKFPRTSPGDAAARRLRGRGPTPPVSGLLGPVRLVAR
jgi:hypothetical protein